MRGVWHWAAGALMLLGWASAPAMTTRCDGGPLQIDMLQPSVWLVPGLLSRDGEADAANRGQVSNLLLVADGERLWLLGSGPSPAFGRRLDCEVRRQLRRTVTDVIAPWARPELVLGQAAFPTARLHAHREVAEAMREQCAGCVERLRLRLGAAAADLGNDPVRLPGLVFDGERGRLGPFDWWTLPRADGRIVSVWHLRGTHLHTAHGLLWGDGPPDGRDTDLRQLAASNSALAAAADPLARWVPEQGPLLASTGPDSHSRYWSALLRAAAEGVDQGHAEGPAPPAAGGPAAWSRHRRHALNWQRAWRQTLDRSLAPPAPR